MNPADDVGAVFSALYDHLNAQVDFFSVPCPEKQLSAAEDTGQSIIHIVGHTEGEFAQGGHFFRVRRPLAPLFMLSVGRGNLFQAVSQPLTC